MFNSVCNHHYYTVIHRLCSLKSTRVSGIVCLEFGPILLSETAKDPAVCCCAPDVPKQLFQEHRKHTLYMINRETSRASPFRSRCLYPGSHQQCALNEAWRCHPGKLYWRLAFCAEKAMCRMDFLDVTLCIQVFFDEDQVCLCSRSPPP